MPTANTVLRAILPSGVVASGAQVALPHTLNINGVGQIPDWVAFDASGWDVVSTTATTITVRNGGPDGSVNVYCEVWYSPTRVLGASGTTALAPRPFVIAGSSASGFSSIISYKIAQTEPFALTDGDPVAISANDGDVFTLTAGALGTRALGAMAGLSAGIARTIVLEFIHGGVGALTFDASYDFGDPGAPAYPAGGTRDIITMVFAGAGNVLCSYVQGYA